MGTRVLAGVLCVLMMFEWPVLAEGLGGSNWANHRAVGGDFNGMGWSSVLYQPLAGAMHVGELLARADGGLVPGVDWGKSLDGLDWSGRTREIVKCCVRR